MKTDKQKLQELIALFRAFDVSFGYTNDDDGVHICCGNEEVTFFSVDELENKVTDL